MEPCAQCDAIRQARRQEQANHVAVPREDELQNALQIAHRRPGWFFLGAPSEIELRALAAKAVRIVDLIEYDDRHEELKGWPTPEIIREFKTEAKRLLEST